MVLFAMLLFAIMAMAALVIDIGFARLAQRQMQSAVDSAALEGLRGAGDPALEFEDRQLAAEAFIAWQFDDDLDPENGDDGIAGDGGRFGAGPNVTFSGGAGDASLAASQLMEVDSSDPTYKPDMQHGPEPDAASTDTFRVSIQRGGVVDGEADLFAEGPAVPYLFARGSFLPRDLIAKGISTGASSSAIPKPALKVGLPIVDIDGVPLVDKEGVPIYPGAIRIGYQLDDWTGTRLNSDGITYSEPRSEPRQLDSEKTVIGQKVGAHVEVPNPESLPDGYCCIYAGFGGEPRVVAFGEIRNGVAVVGENIATANATARLSDVWSDIDPAIRDAVLVQNASVPDSLQVATHSPLR